MKEDNKYFMHFKNQWDKEMHYVVKEYQVNF